MKVIGICGKARSGKDTCGDIIYKQLIQDGKKVVLIHYADLLKWICRSYFGWNGEKDETGRSILQHIGTDLVRRKQPNYWVDFVISFADIFGETLDYLIVPDCRFPNEIDRFKDAGYDMTMLKVLRSGFDNGLTTEQKNHPSETSLDDYPVDFIIENDKDLEELNKKLLQVLSEIESH